MARKNRDVYHVRISFDVPCRREDLRDVLSTIFSFDDISARPVGNYPGDMALEDYILHLNGAVAIKHTKNPDASECGFDLRNLMHGVARFLQDSHRPVFDSSLISTQDIRKILKYAIGEVVLN